jgi:ubiquinone/menaquinone biosynthesis C-methylase UbiE
LATQSYNPDGSPAFDKELERLAARARIGARGFLQRMRKLGVKRGMDVLDLGCGEGTFTLKLASLCQPGRVVGLDSSSQLLAHASRRAVTAGLHHCSFLSGEAESLPFDDASFDCVHSRLVFQHLGNPVQVLTEAFRILKPSGRVIIQDIDHGMIHLHPELPHWADIVSGWQEGQRLAGGDPQVGRKLPGYLREAGFSDVCPRLTTLHGNGNAVRDFATHLGPSLLDYIEDYHVYEQGLRLMDQLASPEVASITDLFLVDFLITARKA